MFLREHPLKDDAVWLEPLELSTLIHGAAHRGVEAEPLLVGTALPGRGRLKVGDRSQGDHFQSSRLGIELIEPSLARHQRID